MGIAYTDTVMGIVLHTLAALGYAVLGMRPWRALMGNASAAPARPQRVGLAVVLLLHAVALYMAMAAPGGVRLGLGLALSSTMWLGMLVFYIESLMIRVDGVRLLLLPLAAVAAFMPVLLPAPGTIENLSTPWLGLHLL